MAFNIVYNFISAMLKDADSLKLSSFAIRRDFLIKNNDMQSIKNNKTRIIINNLTDYFRVWRFDG